MQAWSFAKFNDLPHGPWCTEPDKMQWVDEATGLDALIVRNRYGALCGYVGVPPEHALHGADYDEVEVDVHGRLSFAGPCQEGSLPEGICHIPEPGRPDNVWWLGFDCGHVNDLMPRVDLVNELDVYRDVSYVRDQCVHLAKQLADLRG